MSAAQLKYVLFVLIMLFGVGGALTQRKTDSGDRKETPKLERSSADLALRTGNPFESADPENSPLPSSSPYGKELAQPALVLPAESTSPTIRISNQRKPQSPRFHRVADGDTLHSLAARYLGNGDLAWAIAEANPRQIPQSDLLPIGVVLRIPSLEEASVTEPKTFDNQELQPLARGASSPPSFADTSESPVSPPQASSYDLLEKPLMPSDDAAKDTAIPQPQEDSAAGQSSAHAVSGGVQTSEAMSSLSPVERKTRIEPQPNAPVRSASTTRNVRQNWSPKNAGH